MVIHHLAKVTSDHMKDVSKVSKEIELELERPSAFDTYSISPIQLNLKPWWRSLLFSCFLLVFLII